MTKEDCQQAAALHAQGWSYDKIGKQFGLSEHAVVNNLKLAGLYVQSAKLTMPKHNDCAR